MTAQRHERLILDGVETSMAYCPPLPEGDPRIVETPEDFMWITSCWRGYVGSWEIKNNKFFLRNLTGCFRLDSDMPIFADWFTGVLRVPRGERLVYIHMGFGSIYEEELHIKIVNGCVVKTRVLDNRPKQVNKKKLHILSYPFFANRFDGDDLESQSG